MSLLYIKLAHNLYIIQDCIQQLRKCMIKNPRKLKGKIQARTHPLSCFLAAEGPWFNLGAYWVVKPLKFVFCDLKSRGPLKNSKNFAEMKRIVRPIDWYHSHPPLFFHFTLPLRSGPGFEIFIFRDHEPQRIRTYGTLYVGAKVVRQSNVVEHWGPFSTGDAHNRSY